MRHVWVEVWPLSRLLGREGPAGRYAIKGVARRTAADTTRWVGGMDGGFDSTEEWEATLTCPEHPAFDGVVARGFVGSPTGDGLAYFTPQKVVSATPFPDLQKARDLIVGFGSDLSEEDKFKSIAREVFKDLVAGWNNDARDVAELLQLVEDDTAAVVYEVQELAGLIKKAYE